ncbi:alpha-tubulin N-acetyltransferase 1-like isoform X4 [Oncorhynchus tshawytscha]|uniref:alpha-tubulin N-acetyltransferase 1-like isoform X4 n=1 Tax=Oncorhynchus tshawytscha TaxID=74940 RepID=UPI001C3CBD89|nr:alpha-tubulin N-acetyltransferase 1-like isoform X4 [Oncorhynchus tshawytscha]
METTFDVNHLFPETITVLDQNLIAGGKSLGRSDPQPQIAAVIDELGRASAKAQYLTAPITSASKLQTNKHHLYLLKDGESNGGRGLAVGFLKVGYKKLFLLDQQGAHVETEPLCVLDFFVKENLQRHGYGLELFSFMLQHKKVEPVMMAYDRPSPKFLSFLEKHFCLKNSVPQVNNFVVFDGFFAKKSAAQWRKVPPKKPDGEIKPYSLTEREAVREEQRALPWPLCRHAAPPLSPPLSVSSPCSPSRGRQRPDPALAPAPAPGANRGPNPHPPLINSLNCRAKRTSQQGLVARGNLYSRHVNTRGFGQLLETQPNIFILPGLRPVLRDRETDIGGQREPLGHRDRKEPPPSRKEPPPSRKEPPPSRKEPLCAQTIMMATREPDRQAETETRVLEKGLAGEPFPGRGRGEGGGPLVVVEKGPSEPERDRGRGGSSWGVGGGPLVVVEKGPSKPERDMGTGGWSWMLGESCCNTAQWARQDYRNTRPW